MFQNAGCARRLDKKAKRNWMRGEGVQTEAGYCEAIAGFGETSTFVNINQGYLIEFNSEDKHHVLS
jgi:hypothetical protein